MSTIQTKPKSRIRGLVVTLVTVAAVLVLPTVAVAQDPTSAQYDSTLTQVTAGGPGGPEGEPPGGSASGSASATATGTTDSGSLPFTGLDVAAMVAVAAGLGVAGFAMRRRLVAGNDEAR